MNTNSISFQTQCTMYKKIAFLSVKFYFFPFFVLIKPFYGVYFGLKWVGGPNILFFLFFFYNQLMFKNNLPKFHSPDNWEKACKWQVKLICNFLLNALRDIPFRLLMSDLVHTRVSLYHFLLLLFSSLSFLNWSSEWFHWKGAEDISSIMVYTPNDLFGFS